MQEMQTASQEMGYMTANFSLGPADSQTAVAEALQVLADATTKDRTAVANLLHTNELLNEQVVNLTKTVTAKESEIEELRKSISELSCTICTLAPTNANRGGHGGRGGCGNKTNNSGRGKTKKELPPLNIHYCWTHGVTRGLGHTSVNCGNPAEGHKKEATLFNWMGNSMEGIGA
eukprot:2452258-Ditylum_brightwellii.AAC.1